MLDLSENVKSCPGTGWHHGKRPAGVSVSNKQLNFLTLWVINMSEGTARSLLARVLNRYQEGDLMLAFALISKESRV